MRQRNGVSTLGMIGGLLVLLMVAAAACDDPEPTATPTTAPTATATATAPPTITPTPEPSPTPTPLSVEAVVEATAASMRALESAHIEADITGTIRVTGEEEGAGEEGATLEMSMVGDYQAPDRTRLNISLTIEGDDLEADYISIANETYVHVPLIDMWKVSEPSDGIDVREVLRLDPEGMKNLALIGEEELDGEKVYHLKGSLAGDAGGLLNSVHRALAGVTLLGEVVVEAEFWIGAGDFLVRRTIQNVDVELSSDIGERGELHLEFDMRLSDHGDPVDIQAPDVGSTLGTGPGFSETQSATPIPAPTATPVPAMTIPPPSPTPTPAPEPTPTPAPLATIDMQHATLETLQEAGHPVEGPTQHTFRLNPERPAGLTDAPKPLGSGYYALIELDDGNKLAVMVDVQENVAANREEYPYTGTLYVGKETNGSLADAHEGVIDDCCGVVHLSAPFDYGDETVTLELTVLGAINWQDHPTTLEGAVAVLMPLNARVGHLPETGEAFVLYSYSRKIVPYIELDDIAVWQDIDGDGVVRSSTPGESARASDAVLIGSTKAWEIHSVSSSGKTVRLVQKQTNTPAPDTVVVPAPFEHAMVNVSESDPPHYFLDLVSVLPNTCQTFDGIEAERSGTEITVSITNRAPGGDRSDCEWVSRFMTHSVALGTDFTPGVTYTIRVNGVPGPPILNAGPRERGEVTYALGDDHLTLTFVGRSAPVAVEQPVSGTVAVAAYTRDVVGVSVDESRPPQHFLEIQSAVIGCGEFDRIEVERSGDDIFVSVTNRRPVEGTCTSAGLSYTTHSVSVGTDFEPSVTYTIRVNVRDDSSFTLFSGWSGYDRIENYDTIEVPATIKSLAVSRDVADRRYLDIVSGLPNTCSEFGGAIVEQTGTEITVSVTNRVVADSSADCARLSRSTESFSVVLGTEFKPGVIYTVHVNDLTTTFGGRPTFDTYPIPATIESATVTVAESDPPQYFIDIVSGLPNDRCVLFDQVSIRRSGTDIYIVVRYQAPYSNYVPCLDAPPPPQVHSVALGADFEPGVKYTVRVNDFWTGAGMAPPPDTVSTTFVAAAPTLVRKRTCMLQPAQPITMEQERTIDSLTWAKDNPWSVRELQRLATGSPEAFQAWMQHFGDDETSWPLIRHYASIAFCDEAIALRILQMPFLDQVPVHAISVGRDIVILRELSRLAQSSLDDLEAVLSHPELQGGITDASTALVLLLVLDREDAAAAAAIQALPWIEDGITYTDYDARPSADRLEDETIHVMELVRMAQRANRSFWALLHIPWVRDGISRIEWPIINNLENMALADDEGTARILRMPFLEIVNHDEERITSLLLDVANRGVLRQLVSSPRLDSGIRDGQLVTVALVNVELQNPAAAAALNDLAWLQDGIDSSEQDAVLSIVNAAVESDSIFSALLTKSWVQDGLTPDELEVVSYLSSMASTPVDGTTGKVDEATPLLILDMPFLQDVTPLDGLALSALEALMFSAEEGALQQVLSHPELRGGITDDWTNLVAVTWLAAQRPGLLDVLLNPDQTSVEKLVITLPLAGKVTLSVIEPEVKAALSSTQPGTASLDPMDLLEHTVRTQEEFMGVAFPESHVVLFVADISPEGGGEFGHGVIASDSRSSTYIIAHETAHIWDVQPNWLAGGRTRWIIEGVAEFLTAISERARVGTPLPEPKDSCGLANSIADLVRVEEVDSEVIYGSACNYTLGRGMFLELYDSLGNTAFRQGFRNLYLMSAGEVPAWFRQDECAGRDAGLCYLEAAFFSDMTPEQTAIADEIITRRYYSRSP